MALVEKSIKSSMLLSWYFPSVIQINSGMAYFGYAQQPPRRFNNVCILTAPREYLPSAQDIRLILTDIEVESNANISLSTCSTLGMVELV